MELHKDDTVGEQLRNLKLKYQEVSSELDVAKMATARLEATVISLQQEKNSLTQYVLVFRNLVFRVHETRLANSAKLIDELRGVNAKLEAKFEYQNQIAETNAKEMELMQKEMQRVEKENLELKRTDDDSANKIAALHEQIIRINDQYGQCR